jgi:hypothetical protein
MRVVCAWKRKERFEASPASRRGWRKAWREGGREGGRGGGGGGREGGREGGRVLLPQRVIPARICFCLFGPRSTWGRRSLG